MDPRRPSERKSATPEFAERFLAISSVAKAVRLTTQLYHNILGHNAYVDATLIGVKVTACTVGHLAAVVVNRVIGMDNLNNWACHLLDEVLVWTSGIADPESRPPVESKAKSTQVDQAPRDRGDRVTVFTRKKVKAERKLKEKMILNGHEEIHTATLSEQKHVGCSMGMQGNKVTEFEKKQTEVSRNQRNVEELHDIEVAADNKGVCGAARLGGGVVEVGENGREAENITDRKEIVIGGTEIKGDTEKLGEKNTEKLKMYRNGLEREGSADNKVASTENDNATEAITEKKTETGEFTENETEKESEKKNESERVTEVMGKTEVTENKDDAVVVSEKKYEAEEVAADRNKTEDIKEDKNETEKVMKNNTISKQVVENKTVTETEAEAEGAAETEAEAEGVTKNKLEPEIESKNETNELKESKAIFGNPKGAIDCKQGSSAEESSKLGTEMGGAMGGSELRSGASASKAQSHQTANVGELGQKNKKKKNRRKK